MCNCVDWELVPYVSVVGVVVEDFAVSSQSNIYGRTSLNYIKQIKFWLRERPVIWQTLNAGPLDPVDPMTTRGIICKDASVSISVFSLAQEVDFP